MKKLFLIIFLSPIITYSQYKSWYDSAIANVKSDFAHLIEKEIEDSFYLDVSLLVEGKLEFPYYLIDGITPSFDPNPPTYLKDKKRVLPCAAFLRGQYGVKNLYVGVPVIIGAKGVERIVEIKMNATEKAAFRRSVSAVRKLVKESSKLINSSKK